MRGTQTAICGCSDGIYVRLGAARVARLGVVNVRFHESRNPWCDSGDRPFMADSRRLGDEIHPWSPNSDLRPDLVVHDRWRECRLSDRNPVVQLRRSVRLLIAINESQRMRERPGNHHEKAFKKDFLGDCRQTSKTRQRPLGLSGGLWILPTAPGLSNGIAQLCGTVRGGSSRSG